MQTPAKRQLHRIQYYSPNPQRRARARHAPQKSSYLSFKTIAGIVALVVAIGFGLHHVGASSSPKPAVKGQQTSAPEPVKPTITQAQMAEQIGQILAANPNVDISVSVGDPRDGSVQHSGTNAVYEAASVAKVLTGVFYLHEVEGNRQSLDKTIGAVGARQLLQIMIEQSDNTAWKALNDVLTHEQLLKYAQSIGFANYNPEINTFTSDDIARLLIKLQQGKLLNYEHTQLILGHMKNASRSEYLKPALPADTTLYHKAGWLENRIHDAAIIDDGHRPYVLVIFTKGRSDQIIPSPEILQQIAKVTVARFISSE